MDEPAQRPAIEGRSEPHWVIRDVIIVLVIGLFLAGFQIWMDDRRSDREQRQDNLRFVREWSMNPDPNDAGPLPFRSIDLAGMNLSLLSLNKSDFSGANLDRAVLEQTDLTEGWFRDTSLRDANLRGAKLYDSVFDNANFDGATLQGAFIADAALVDSSFDGVDFREAHLSRTSLDGSDLSGALNLDTTKLTGVCHNSKTKWPSDFNPPAAAKKGCPDFIGGGSGW